VTGHRAPASPAPFVARDPQANSWLSWFLSSAKFHVI
jgi:hypothetical protein